MTPTICRRTRALLPSLLTGSIDHATWIGHWGHVGWCADCASLVFAHLALWAQLEGWRDATVTPDLDRTLRAALQRRDATHPAWR